MKVLQIVLGVAFIFMVVKYNKLKEESIYTIKMQDYTIRAQSGVLELMTEKSFMLGCTHFASITYDNETSKKFIAYCKEKALVFRDSVWKTN